MPETKGITIIRAAFGLLLAGLVSACSLNALPQSAATTLAQERTPAAGLSPTTTASPSLTATAMPTATTTRAVAGAVLPPTTVNCTVRTDWLAYSVAAGDTLFRIAQRGGTTVNALVAANCLSDPSRIEAGQILYVPNPIGGTDGVAPTMVPDEPVRYYLILPGDNGASAPLVGCQDSIMRINSGLTRTGVVTEDVAAALNVLFNAQAQAEGAQYANAFYGKGLVAASVTQSGARLNVSISGQLVLSGVCEDARMRAQLLHTVFQYGDFSEAYITIGGQNAKLLFDASGTVPADAVFTRAEAM